MEWRWGLAWSACAIETKDQNQLKLDNDWISFRTASSPACCIETDSSIDANILSNRSLSLRLSEIAAAKALHIAHIPLNCSVIISYKRWPAASANR
jgi:hypothetical protein